MYKKTPLAIGMLLQSRKASADSRPILVKLGSVSALVVLALLIALSFHDLVGILGSGAITACAIFIVGLYAAGYLLGGCASADKKEYLASGPPRAMSARPLVPSHAEFFRSKGNGHACCVHQCADAGGARSRLGLVAENNPMFSRLADKSNGRSR